jgi:hypothetical protein
VADLVPVERAVLGGVLLNNALWPQAAALDPSDFFLQANGIIYKGMRDLVNSGCPVDTITLVAELERHGDLDRISGIGYLSDLIDGVVERPSIEHFVKMIRDAAGARHIVHGTEEIRKLADKGTGVTELRAHLVDLDRSAEQYEPSNSSAPIRGFDSVPDLLTMQIDPMDYVVQGLLPRKSLTLWTGTDGVAKTYLAQNLAIAVSTGGKFLGAQCRKMPVLYLDYENPDFVVQDRLQLMGAAPGPNLRVWGTWNPEQPPQVGNQLLPTIAKAVQPLMIFDPFRYSHGAEENDSTEMMQVMKDLRACVVAGATVIVFHHPAKAEGSTGRGSSAIRGATDLAYLQELSDDTGLITLSCVKNRFGERPKLTIRPDFEEGTFEVTDSPEFTKALAEVDALAEIISERPGLSQNQVLDRWPGKRERVISLLKKYSGDRWQRIKKGQAWSYVPPVPVFGNQSGIRELVVPCKDSGRSGSPVPSLYKGTGGNHFDPVDPGDPSTSSQTDSPRCYLHPKNTFEWWTRPDGSEVCGLCHPNRIAKVWSTRAGAEFAMWARQDQRVN